MAQHVEIPPADTLRQIFNYSLVTGEVTWNKHPSPQARKCKPGVRVGHKTGRCGHYSVELFGQVYQLHRLIWRMVTGDDPGELVIDHINGDPTNNAWHNLRLATYQQNSANTTRSITARTGLVGAYPCTQSSGFFSRIRHKGEEIYLGSFSTADEASQAYREALEELNGEFARL